MFILHYTQAGMNWAILLCRGGQDYRAPFSSILQCTCIYSGWYITCCTQFQSVSSRSLCSSLSAPLGTGTALVGKHNAAAATTNNYSNVPTAAQQAQQPGVGPRAVSSCCHCAPCVGGKGH